MTLTADRHARAGTAEPPGGPAAGSAGRIAGPAAGSHRDPAIDAARAVCLVVVFVLHAMMVGVSVGPGGPVLENALDGWAGFAPATWVVQVMPLFFVIGGYAGVTQWRRMHQKGADASAFVRARLARLVRPAIVLVAVVATTLAGLGAVGLPGDVVATAGYRVGQPLWFLAVYIGCSSLVPLMAWLDARHRWPTLSGLVAVVVSVDATRLATGVDAIGFVNLLAVWLLVQQLGFLLADGTIERMPRRARLVLAGAALGVLAVMTLAGPYSPDLFSNLNPPTACLVVLGITQLALFTLVRPALRRWAERPGQQRMIARFGEWGMTLYLWHLPAFVLLAGGLLVLRELAGVVLPAPLTGEWWSSRPAWLVAAALVTAMFVRAFARWERHGGAAPLAAASGQRVREVPVALAVVAGIVGVGGVLVLGFGVWTAAASLVLLGLALRGSRASSRPAPVSTAAPVGTVAPGAIATSARRVVPSRSAHGGAE